VDVESLYSELSTPKKSIRIVDDEVGKLAVDEIAEILQSLGKGLIIKSSPDDSLLGKIDSLR
jgi:hypothetical protein